MASAIVIGSGIAGLAGALRLHKKGFDVKVFEANEYAGGKLHAFTNNGFRFDFGPSLFTMPHLVDELFQLHNINPKEYFQYIKKETICNYFWDDGITFSVPANQKEFTKQASITFNEKEETIKKYLDQNKVKYDLTANIFLHQSLHKWKTYASAETIRSLLKASKLDINSNLNQVNQKSFSNPKLVQLFNRYATYNGSSPYSTPGIMSMIPHLEMDFGTFFPKEGMHAISQSLYKLAKDVGISFHFNEAVTKINHSNTSVSGVETSKGNYEADIVMSNMDIFSTYKKLLPKAKQPHKILNQERSSSAVIFYWGINKTFPQLDLHNIFFSSDYKKEFEYIFHQHKIYDDPTVYINITSKEKKDDAPKNCENWFVMVNTPHNTGQDWNALKKQLKADVLKKLSKALQTNIEEYIISENTIDPIEIEKKTSSHLGSLYGTSSNSKFAAFLRHSNFSNQFNNLYFCGGSVHPGGGIPLCLLSSKITMDQIKDAEHVAV
ncbi:MAG: phytoene desaturase [Bacteroidia bacterium]|nr:phytoene desaturase [Bacteroidia bacterium]